MIRLTELGRDCDTVWVRLEGSLAADALRVLQSLLADLAAAGTTRVVLEGDGIVHVDPIAVRAWPSLAPEGVDLRLTTGRRSLHRLLTSYGVTIDFVPGGDAHP